MSEREVSRGLMMIGLQCYERQIESAKQTAAKIEAELGNLNGTLKNIEDARPFNQLTVRSLTLLMHTPHSI